MQVHYSLDPFFLFSGCNFFILTNNILKLDIYSRLIIFYGGIVLYTHSSNLTHILVCDDIPSATDLLGYSDFFHSDVERVHLAFNPFLNPG